MSYPPMDGRHVRALLRVPKLARSLAESTQLSGKRLTQFDELTESQKEDVLEEVREVMRAFAPFQAFYAGPVPEYCDDIWVYGTRGFYLVRMTCDEQWWTYTTKSAAMAFAKDSIKVQYDIARDAGWFEDETT